MTNRFGEFDLGKLFPNDTIYVSLEGFQNRQLKPSLNMKIKLEVEIDTKEDQTEITGLIDLVTEFRDRLIALEDGEDYDD